MANLDIDYLEFTVGDTARAITATLTDGDGNAVNLTGNTVAFRMTPQGGDTAKVDDAAATIDDAATGQVSYSWATADVDAAGTYEAQFIRTVSGKTEHFPTGEKLIVVFKNEV